jgi:predicted secreted protein
MNWPFAIGVFFLVWWIVWFAVLPWGVKGQHEGSGVEPGSDPGAPQRPLLARKILATTAISALVVAVAVLVWETGIIPIEKIPLPFDLPTR